MRKRDVIDGCVKGKTKEITLPSKTHPSKYHNTLDYSFKRDLLDLDSSSSFFSISAHVTLSIALSNLTKPTIDAFSSSSFSPFRLDNRLDIFVITFTIVIQDTHLSFSNMQNAYRARLQFLDPIQSSNQMFTGISLIFIIYIYILCITRFLHSMIDKLYTCIHDWSTVPHRFCFFLSDLSDIRRNVPGEPGIDYPAYTTLPQTGFTCEGRSRGEWNYIFIH